METKYRNKAVHECTYLTCRNTKTEWGGNLRACGGCSVAGKGVALYCSIQCQKSDWPRHKIQCKQDKEDKAAMPDRAKKTIEDIVIWDRKNRAKLIAAAISALDLCHFPDNADEFVFFVALADTPGAKHRFTVSFAGPILFEQYEELYGAQSGNPREDQRIGQERAKAKSETCISFQIVEFAEGCRNTFQTWMMPKDMHGYRTTGFGVINWQEILLAECAWPRGTIPRLQVKTQKFTGNYIALRTWRDIHQPALQKAAIHALNLAKDPEAGKKTVLVVYLRYTGSRKTIELVQVESAFVFSLEEIKDMFDQSVWNSVEAIVKGLPRYKNVRAEEPAPCVICQLIDPFDPTQAPAFTIPVKTTPALLSADRDQSWKQTLTEAAGGGEFHANTLLYTATLFY